MAALWPDRIVTDNSLTQCVKDLRKALGTDAETLVRTVHGRGYVLESKLFDVCASPKMRPPPTFSDPICVQRWPSAQPETLVKRVP